MVLLVVEGGADELVEESGVVEELVVLVLAEVVEKRVELVAEVFCEGAGSSSLTSVCVPLSQVVRVEGEIARDLILESDTTTDGRGFSGFWFGSIVTRHQ